MKNSTAFHPWSLVLALFTPLLAIAALLAAPAAAPAALVYVGEGGNGTQGTGSVGEYNATTGGGGTIITGLNSPRGLALSLNDLYVAEVNSNTVGEYDATTGTTINGSFITGLSDPIALTVEPLPEPTTLVLAAIGALALLGRAPRRQRRGHGGNTNA